MTSCNGRAIAGPSISSCWVARKGTCLNKTNYSSNHVSQPPVFPVLGGKTRRGAVSIVPAPGSSGDHCSTQYSLGLGAWPITPGGTRRDCLPFSRQAAPSQVQGRHGGQRSQPLSTSVQAYVSAGTSHLGTFAVGHTGTLRPPNFSRGHTELGSMQCDSPWVCCMPRSQADPLTGRAARCPARGILSVPALDLPRRLVSSLNPQIGQRLHSAGHWWPWCFGKSPHGPDQDRSRQERDEVRLDPLQSSITTVFSNANC